MFLNDRKSADRVRAQRTLFSLWMAVAALAVIVTMMAGLATSAKAAQDIDAITTSSIATAPVSQAYDRIVIVGLVSLAFMTLAVGGIALTINSIRETSRQHRRDR